MGGRPGSSRAGEGDFTQRFRKALSEAVEGGEGPRRGDGLVVALSGGLDSLVLLHLLRFLPELPEFPLSAAHFDHRMRSGSQEDAEWVRGLCAAWGVPLRSGWASTPPRTEEEARIARYEFLAGARDAVGARWLLTAHHADDQAETVLFRALRGTGLGGLGGIPTRRAPGILRPLLPFSRRELEEYARAARIRPREDPTNRDTSIPRNYLRQVALPSLEVHVAPAARRSLVRLAHLARENEVAWSSLIPGLLAPLLEPSDRGVVVVRSAFLAYHPTVQARLLREVVRRQGLRLSEAGTRSLLEFTRTGASGRFVSLPGGMRLYREFDRFLLAPASPPMETEVLVLSGPEEGSGELVLGASRFEFRWGEAEEPGMKAEASFAVERLGFPLRLRGWVHGDRIRLPYGTKKLKKLLHEAGIAAGERDRIPVLVEASGNVLWVVGVAVADRARPEVDEEPFFIGMSDAHQS